MGCPTRRRTDREANRLKSVGVQQEEGLSHFGGFGIPAGFDATHLPFGVAPEPMGIDGQHPAQVMTAGSAQLAQGDLQSLGLSHGMGVKELMNGLIGRDERQAVGQFETFLTERAPLAQIAGAQG